MIVAQIIFLKIVFNVETWNKGNKVTQTIDRQKFERDDIYISLSSAPSSILDATRCEAFHVDKRVLFHVLPEEDNYYIIILYQRET